MEKTSLTSRAKEFPMNAQKFNKIILSLVGQNYIITKKIFSSYYNKLFVA